MVSRYEEVRGYVMRCQGGGVSTGQGLALMLHQGMAVWLWAWLNAGDAPAVRPASELPAARRSTDATVTAQIVSIMATMALNDKRETAYDSAR